MRVLLDTDAFLWWLSDSEKLSTAVTEEIEHKGNDIADSAASVWEIATKFRIGKLPDCEAVALDVDGHIRGQGFQELAIGVVDAERAGRLPGAHRDPFDRMLAALALARDLIVISADPVFDRFAQTLVNFLHQLIFDPGRRPRLKSS